MPLLLQIIKEKAEVVEQNLSITFCLSTEKFKKLIKENI
jgi:hypothetical protein